jgi:ubiquitin-conjugating enzyme E2 Z
MSIISQETAKRLVKDIRAITKDPPAGIFYMHDDTNILAGKALIIGPPDTPYEGGYYFFRFAFPENYPHSPPKLTYCTNDGKTRMHPNLYKNGKVCLSLLNTWSGDAWTGCNTITSILLVIRSIMTKEPLTHEPGLDSRHKDFYKYEEIIRYKNIQLATINVFNQSYYKTEFTDLLEIAKSDFLKNLEKKKEILDQAENIWKKGFLENSSSKTESSSNNNILYTSIYSMAIEIDYESLTDKLLEVADILSK